MRRPLLPHRRASRAVGLLLVVVLAAPALAGCVWPWSAESSNQRSGPGDHGLLYIQPAPYSKIHVVIDSVKGYGPNPQAVEELKGSIREVLQKAVTVTEHAIVEGRGDGYGYSFKEITALETKYRKDYHAGDTAVMYFLYLDGHSDQDTSDNRVLGAAYHGSSVVMFKNSLRRAVEDNRGLLGPGTSELERIVERSVLIHEMGHLLGLVNNGIPMVKDHEDKDPKHSPKHSTNKESVMYWAVESSRALYEMFFKVNSNTDLPYKFDADDKADIAAARRS